MIPYLCYVISPILITALVNNTAKRSVITNQKGRKLYLWICGLVITLMVGLRHYGNGSGDSYFYYQLWESMSGLSLTGALATIWQMDLEKGFLLCVWVLSQIFEDPQFVFILSGLFFAVSICRFVDKNCENVILPLLFFNCLGLFNFMVQGMRQAIAICICLFAVEACKNRKLIKFLLLIGLAMTFHASAILFVPVYWLFKLRFNVKSMLFFTVCCVAALLALPYLLKIVNRVMNENYTLAADSTDNSGIVAIFIYLAIILFGAYVAYVAEGNVQYTPYLYMAIIGMMAMIMRKVSIGGIVERANHYYLCAQMVIASESLQRLRKGRVRRLISIAIALLCIAVAVYKASYSVLIPYRFFWQ